MALDPLPAGFADARRALHRVAENVLAPACVAATGHEIELEPTADGFGTPPFPDGGRLRVEGTDLVRSDGDGTERREPLDVDPAGARALARFYAFAADVLGSLRAETAPELDPSPVGLWPEHFDLAFDVGPEGRRVGYGASPGDDEHEEPYLYVGPWVAPAPGPLWNAVGFTGGELRYAELTIATDPRAAALAFLCERRDALLA